MYHGPLWDVIIKWGKFGTLVPLRRARRRSDTVKKTRRQLFREASKRPTATLKEMQGFLPSSGRKLCDKFILHMFAPGEVWWDGRLFLLWETSNCCYILPKKYTCTLNSMWGKRASSFWTKLLNRTLLFWFFCGIYIWGQELKHSQSFWKAKSAPLIIF